LKFKKKIIVEIKGGFGNQVFQYMFAHKLRNDGFKVKVNTRFYDQFKPNEEAENTYRSLVLPPEIF
jgi:endo-alpha-1,4-polygalactosaminidase (GH114 family)